MVWCARVLRSFRRSWQSSSHHWKCGTDCPRTTTFRSWMRSRSEWFSTLVKRRLGMHITPILPFALNVYPDILLINIHCSLRDKLTLMQHVGVCFKLVGRQDENAVYLFPSLSSFSGLLFLPPCISFSFSCSVFVVFFFFFFHPFCSTSTNEYHAEKIKFSISQPHKFRYSGLRINASSNQVFTSGFFCRLVVTIFAALNVSIQAILIHLVHPFAFAFVFIFVLRFSRFFIYI